MIQETLENYQSGTMNASEIEQLDKLLLVGLFYRQEKKKWEAVTAKIEIEKQRKKINFRRWILGIAASFLALVYFLNSTTLPTLTDRNIVAIRDESPVYSEVRAGTETIKTSDWQVYYKEKNYSACIQAIEAVTNGAQTDKQLYFLGLSYLYAVPSNSKKAIECFKKVLDKDANYKDEARWVMALCYIKIGENRSAKLLLENFKSATTDWKKQEATELLRKL